MSPTCSTTSYKTSALNTTFQHFPVPYKARGRFLGSSEHMLYNTGFQHVSKTKKCSQHQFSTMSSNTPTASRLGLVAYKPWNNVRWLHSTATRGRLDSQRKRCWPWVVRHMPQTRRYLGYGRTFLKHGGRCLRVLDTILQTRVVKHVFTVWNMDLASNISSNSSGTSRVCTFFRPCPHFFLVWGIVTRKPWRMHACATASLGQDATPSQIRCK
jgi:hypothetical protein